MYAQYNDTQDKTGIWLSRRNARKVVAMSHDDALRMHSRLFATSKLDASHTYEFYNLDYYVILM